ncbi:TIGR01440 family protein [Salibacterium aidingense]|uniref:TIGR01440 family protein n=1 Tax=Salibacterium aidingense TaxID=384933 RepID=UPI003BEE2F1E
MNDQMKEWQTSLQSCLELLRERTVLDNTKLLVIGASTSEVIGSQIGSAGSEEAAEALYDVLAAFQQKTGVHLVFQGCEHINRALVMERTAATEFRWEEVTVIPHRRAGGAMAAHAYASLSDPVVVEHVQADAGIDIGDTFIGMHLKHVAVPVRGSVSSIGEAHVTMAVTRPKLIGGARARYPEA